MNQQPTDNDLFNVHPSHQPDWPEWQAKHHAPIRHLVFLSINICPLTALGLSRHGNLPGWEKLHDEDFYPDYFRRLDAILNHVQGNSEWFHPIHSYTESPENTTISFGEFANFARNHAWPLPTNFPGQPKEDREESHRTHRWPWGDYTNDRLEVFAKAVHRFWSDYDPSEPEAAPENGEIEAFLEKEGIKIENVRQAMCALMRHETAPSGRRKKR